MHKRFYKRFAALAASIRRLGFERVELVSEQRHKMGHLTFGSRNVVLYRPSAAGWENHIFASQMRHALKDAHDIRLNIYGNDNCNYRQGENSK